MGDATCELYIYPAVGPTGIAADLRVAADDSEAEPATLARAVPLALDMPSLVEQALDPQAYGRSLTAQVFAEARLRDAWGRANAATDFAAAQLRVRLRIDLALTELHTIQWETLRDPVSDVPLALSEQTSFARVLDNDDLRPVTLPYRPALRALVAVASPVDLQNYRLAAIDTTEEIAHARAALGPIDMQVLGGSQEGATRVTVRNLIAGLQEGIHIFYLMCHGTLHDSEPYLWLEKEDGTSDRVPGRVIVEAIRRLRSRPLLIVLAACATGGQAHHNVLAALGPQLALVGVPAVLAMAGNVVQPLIRTLLPPFFAELCKDTPIDQALAMARARSQDAQWWSPVLWMRIRHGRLWSSPIRNGAILGTPVDALPVGEAALALARYRERVLSGTRYINLAGIPLPRDRSGRPLIYQLPLDNVYMQLQAVSETRRRDQQEAERYELERHIVGPSKARQQSRSVLSILRQLGEYLYRQGQTDQSQQRPDPIDPELALQQQRRLVVLGAPGSGKSTLLRYLARRAAYDPQAGIPILVSLRDYAAYCAGGGSDTLQVFALKQAARGDEQLYGSLRSTARLLWLLDALDEARDWRERITHQIAQLPGNLLVTSRPLDYQPGGIEALPHYELMPITPADVKRFLNDWFSALAEQRAQAHDWVAERVHWLQMQLDQRPAIRTLTHNPLLLTFLVVLSSETPLRDLPAQRADLYRRYIAELLDSWEAQRGLSGEQQWRKQAGIGGLSDFEFRHAALRAFHYMGWYLHLAYHGGPVDYQPTALSLVEGLARYLAVEYALDPSTLHLLANAALHFWQEAGMIDEWIIGDARYLAFRHLTFQEYAAAWGLAEAWKRDTDAAWAFLRSHMHHYAWREPLLLLTGMIPPSRLNELLWELLRRRSPYERLLHRNLYTAAAIASEAPDVDSAIVRAIVRRLAPAIRGSEDPRTLTVTAMQLSLVLVGILAVYLWGSGGWTLLGGVIACIVFGVTLWEEIPYLRGLILLPGLPWLTPPELDKSTKLLGELGGPALPVLTSALYRKPSRNVSAALARIGPSALPVLADAMVSKKWEASWAAAEGMELLGEQAKALLKRFRMHKDLNVRLRSAVTLCALGDEASVSDMIHALSYPKNRSRAPAAANALGKSGSQRAIRPLILASFDSDEYMRYQTLLALTRIGAATAVGVYSRMLIDPDEDNRTLALQALRQQDMQAVAAQLALALGNPEWEVRRDTAIALGVIGLRELLPKLLQAAHDPVWAVRRCAVQALGQIGSSTVIPALLGALEDSNSEVRWTAAEALGVAGSLEATPSLMACLEDGDEWVRRSAALALGRLQAEATMPVLTARLLDDTEVSHVRQAAAQAIGMIGSQEALPALSRALRIPDLSLRQAVVQALGLLNTAEALPVLIAATRSREQSVCEAAIGALERLGTVEAVWAIVRKLRDRREPIRIAAARAVGRLTPSVHDQHLLEKLKRSLSWAVLDSASVMPVALDALEQVVTQLEIVQSPLKIASDPLYKSL